MNPQSPLGARSNRRHSDAAHRPVQHRGTALLMVVGVLALLAVIAVAYVTLGKADRTTSTAAQVQQRVEDQAQRVADYLTSVIGQDVFDVHAERTPAAGGTPTFRREASDYPDCDPLMISAFGALQQGDYQFNPSGTVLGALPANGPADRRRTSDPWLASSRPTRYLDERDNLSQFQVPIREDELRLIVDWGQISNFAPDGRFVNLANLRNNFEVAPGYGMFFGRPRTSENLTLINPATGQSYPTTAGSQRFDSVRVSSDPSIQYRPYTWTVYQRGAFRPMVDTYPPGDFRHVNNQWADTDGDGMADARWFEVVNAFNQDTPEYLIPRNSRLRWFVAARAIDLSGLVNVNTAGDGVYAPGYIPDASYSAQGAVAPMTAALKYYPWGLTPADVDLRRLLMQSDDYFALGRGYEDIPNPTDRRSTASYSGYLHTPPGNSIAAQVGRGAYAGVRAWLDAGVRLTPNDAVGGTGANSALLVERAGRSTPSPLGIPSEPDARRARFEIFGIDPSGATDPRSSAVLANATDRVFSTKQAFGLESEYELRAFQGVNDSDVRSALELATAGRGGTASPLSQFDPLRSNRPRSLEMQGRPDSTDGRASIDALMQTQVDVRSLLTTVNGARPIAARVVANPFVLDNPDLKTDFLAIRGLIAPLQMTGASPPEPRPAVATDQAKKKQAINALYQGYVNALAPFRDRFHYPTAWNPAQFDAASGRRGNSLSYGGASAELAVFLSAFLTANTTDALDVDNLNDPTVLALNLEVNGSGSTNQAINDAISNDVELAPLADFPQRGGPNAPRSKLALVYGIEPQPFLIEAGYFALFTDAPDDVPNSSGDANHTNPADPGYMATPVTIDFKRPTGGENADYICEIMAFQLTNPFEERIELTDSNTNPIFYIEYAGRTFALTAVSDDGQTVGGTALSLRPGETKVFVAISPVSINQIEDRIRNNLRDSSFAVNLKDKLKQRFGADMQLVPVVERKDLRTFEGRQTIGSTEFVDLMDFTSTAKDTSVRLWRRKSETLAASGYFGADILVDRLRFPQTNVTNFELAQKFGSSPAFDDEIDGTTSGPDPTNFTSPPPTSGSAGNDNTGYSIALWRTVRRPVDPSFFPNHKGVMPPWCIERRDDDVMSASSMNTVDDKANPDSYDRGDYRDEDFAFENLVGLLNKFGGTNDALNSQLAKKAEDKNDGQNIADPRSTIWDYSNPASLTSRQAKYPDVAARIMHVGAEGNLMLFSRPGDLLLPLAIGPFYDPTLETATNPTPTTDFDRENVARMTLSEALALAGDYWSPNPATYGGTWVEYLALAAHQDVTNPMVRPILNRGQLVIDDFAPYRDVNNNGQFDPGTDESIGAGVPMALNVLSEFNTGGFDRAYAPGSLQQAVAGKVNVNTAPLPVLRVVPGLAPSPDPSTANAPWEREVVADSMGTNSYFLYNPYSATDTFDIAAAVRSYADKSDVLTRPERDGQKRDLIEFAEGSSEIADPAAWKARSDRTKITGIREAPGILSEGELGAVVIRARRSDNTEDRQNSIDRLGRDAAELVWPGLSAQLMKKNSTDTSDVALVADSQVDGLDERLALVNAAINSVSVRSDVFCVWFVMQGYTQSDVNNLLSDADPLIPSVRRRFMMIVDRSNVTAIGVKPRVLLFKELPVE